MWKNYWLTSYRTFKRNKFYITVNLISIATAISLCIIGWFNFQFNNTFNEYFPNAEKTYKVNSQLASDEYAYGMGASTATLATAINQKMAGMHAVRYHTQSVTVRNGDHLFKEHAAFVDKEFLDEFRFNNKVGRNITLNSKLQAIISLQAAERLFGELNPVNQTIEIIQPNGEKILLQVIDVVTEYPQNTSFGFDILLPIENYFDMNNLSESDPSVWVNGTFVRSENEISSKEFNAMLADHLKKQNRVNEELSVLSYRLDSILEWPHFESKLYKPAFRNVLHPASVIGTISSAVAILLLACFNFVNTTIAISKKRLKEIGVRKVVGSSQKGLMVQFFAESLIQIFIALVLAGGISYYLTDAYNALFEFEIVQFEFLDALPFVIFLFVSWIVIGVLSGLYPALYISRYPSLEIFNNRIKFSNKNRLAKGLLAFQFAVCVYNLFGLIIFVQNARYQEQLDRGYEATEVLNIPMSDASQFEVLASQFVSHPKVREVGATENVVGYGSSDLTITHNGEDRVVAGLRIGENYLQTLGIELKAGNYFNKTDYTNIKKVIVNETMVSQHGIGLEDVIIIDQKRYLVSAIVKDFNFRSILLNNKIRPLVIMPSSASQYSTLSLRVNENELIDFKSEAEKVWYELFPDQLYNGYYQERVMRSVRHTNKIMLSINWFIGIVSILISALGLYSMAALNIQNRLKEFGVRKVLGATVSHIAFLINKDLLLLLGISSVIGLATGFVVISNLLDIIYAYHMDIELVNYIWPVLIILFVSLVTVGLRTFTAAKTNPVQHLRME